MPWFLIISAETNSSSKVVVSSREVPLPMPLSAAYEVIVKDKTRKILNMQLNNLHFFIFFSFKNSFAVPDISFSG